MPTCVADMIQLSGVVQCMATAGQCRCYKKEQVILLPHQTSLSVATDCNRLQPIGMLGVSPNFGAKGSNTSNTSDLLASRRENPYRL